MFLKLKFGNMTCSLLTLKFIQAKLIDEIATFYLMKIIILYDLWLTVFVTLIAVYI